jgi:hypothetical protein
VKVEILVVGVVEDDDGITNALVDERIVIATNATNNTIHDLFIGFVSFIFVVWVCGTGTVCRQCHHEHSDIR